MVEWMQNYSTIVSGKCIYYFLNTDAQKIVHKLIPKCTFAIIMPLLRLIARELPKNTGLVIFQNNNE